MIAETIVKLAASEGASAKRSKQRLIRKVAVLGAGNMGARIAAHIANAGIPAVLLDVVPPGVTKEATKTARSQIAQAALDALKTVKPAAFYQANGANLITVGNLEDDLDLLRDCDWIIEAVVENLEIKRELLQKIAPYRSADALVTTNTSGLPISQIAAQMDADFRYHWFGTHFFNPPRYMRLLEIIPTPETDPAALENVAGFAEKRLGKTVVFAHDTPNFIGNRIGIFALMNTIRIMQQMDLTIEQVDVLTGSVLGWPKTGTFRLSDMVGIDVLSHVAMNFFERVQDERSDLALPPFLKQLLANRWLGDKTKQGFYKKVKGPGGEEERFALDWKTLEYRPAERAKFPSVELAKNSDSLAERLKLLLAGDPRKDKAAAFYWQILPELWNYSAYRVGEIAADIVSIDNAMKTGFNWEMGPFEMWDAAGVANTAEKMRANGLLLAPALVRLLESGHITWYRDDALAPAGRVFFDLRNGDYRPVPANQGNRKLQSITKSKGVIKKNAGASLIDLGDGVAAIEFHTKMNAIGGDILSLVTQTLKADSEAVTNFEAFVIANDGENFSAGANLLQLLLAIQEQEWDELNLVIRSFQNMTQSMKFCPRPVVVAPFNMCLGGGAEVVLHGASRQAHAELYMGLVETGVGLIPAGGGCKEMLLRAVDSSASAQSAGVSSDSVELIDTLRRTFETIAMAKVSTSAREARDMGFLTAADGITMNRDRLLQDAKAHAREMADAGYTPPVPRTDAPAPGENVLATLRMGVRLMREAEYISDHDVKIANSLAYVLCGGKITPGTPISEQYLLDLEREAFLSLCGEPKTAERIAHTLKTGKPLRN